MSDLVEGLYWTAADRIKALEAALREAHGFIQQIAGDSHIAAAAENVIYDALSEKGPDMTLVERLRAGAAQHEYWPGGAEAMTEAADRIEALERERDEALTVTYNRIIACLSGKNETANGK